MPQSRHPTGFAVDTVIRDIVYVAYVRTPVEYVDGKAVHPTIAVKPLPVAARDSCGCPHWVGSGPS